jgi:hypothetical protein
MPQLLTNIKAHQQIDGYGSFNDIMNLTISRQSKIMSIELSVKIPVGFVDLGAFDGLRVGGLNGH